MENFKNKDYYQILGINSEATLKEIKSAYRTLARKYHPDVNPGNKLCEEKFKEVGEAYSILADEAKRRSYDISKGYKTQQDQSSSKTSQQTKKQASSAYSSQKEKDKQPKSAQHGREKTFNDVFSEFVDGFWGSQKQDKTQSEPPKKGDDITTDINITIVEAHNGAIRKVNILHTDQCPRCRGKKAVNNVKCPLCDGKGELSNHKKINVKIPSNVKDGSKIRIVKEGNKGLNGGENGDLYLIVRIQKSELFAFENLNVLCDVPISPTEAALGAEIEIPTIDGTVLMKIPPETQSGQKFRLTGEGIGDSKTGKKGDQIITTIIEIPKNLTEKERQLYQELGNLRKFNPRENITYEK